MIGNVIEIKAFGFVTVRTQDCFNVNKVQVVNRKNYKDFSRDDVILVRHGIQAGFSYKGQGNGINDGLIH